MTSPAWRNRIRRNNSPSKLLASYPTIKCEVLVLVRHGASAGAAAGSGRDQWRVSASACRPGVALSEYARNESMTPTVALRNLA